MPGTSRFEATSRHPPRRESVARCGYLAACRELLVTGAALFSAGAGLLGYFSVDLGMRCSFRCEEVGGLASPAGGAGGRGVGERPVPGRPEGTDMLPQIDHILVLMMENHTYDNYLGMLGRSAGERPRAVAPDDIEPLWPAWPPTAARPKASTLTCWSRPRSATISMPGWGARWWTGSTSSDSSARPRHSRTGCGCGQARWSSSPGAAPPSSTTRARTCGSATASRPSKSCDKRASLSHSAPTR
jgi:hypothetical protein